VAPGIIVSDLNVGLLFFLAMSSLGVYSVVLAGWSSNNKYALVGGLRAAAQMLSYEVFMGLSLMGVVLLAGSFSLAAIVEAQKENLVRDPAVPGFVLFLIAGSPKRAAFRSICPKRKANSSPVITPNTRA
jgi:NADH-quinone oxidoreductase subunit H